MRFRTKAVATGTVLALVPTGLVALALLDHQSQGSHALAASAQVPEAYRDLVTQAGSQCDGVTPGLIAAQIAQESSWDPTVTSSAGAQGISQFMPGTWAAVGADHDGDGVADPTNPADAIPTQATYMCDQLDQVRAAQDDGRLPADQDPVALTLAAYNAGLGAVLDAGGIPLNGETPAYVSTITANAATYEAVTQDSAPQAAGDVQAALDWAKQIAADDSHQYVLGAEGPHYDCSGLSQAFMRMLGVELVHKADTQARDDRGQVVAGIAQAQPGDLLFWGGPGYYHHVAIYAGDGMMVSADTPAAGINYEPVYDGVTLIRRFTS